MMIDDIGSSSDFATKFSQRSRKLLFHILCFVVQFISIFMFLSLKFDLEAVFDHKNFRWLPMI